MAESNGLELVGEAMYLEMQELYPLDAARGFRACFP
ncbi:hypothetical protein DW087_07410 [Olsenella sp. AM04-33]|nr:hypothetical protein DW087_07410 [Olsenella sp. AM04-33]